MIGNRKGGACVRIEGGSNPRPAGQPLAARLVNELRRKLLEWYDVSCRDLPWRKTRDPYRIWISEIMLQQTRVQAVIPYYERFLRRFPHAESLAVAEEQELLACWSGLGYYSRARNLQKAARAIVGRHGGMFPRELSDALALPGIGSYTAAAVLSIAYGAPLAVLDGNVARVLSRLFAMPVDVRSNAGKQSLLKKAEILLSRNRPGDFNQAMMELGATICLPRQPQCGVCPLGKICRAFLTGQTAAYPPARRKAAAKLRRYVAALILDDSGNCLLTRRPASAQWMQGFWELPMREQVGERAVSGDGASPLRKGIFLGTLLGQVRHTITNNKLEVSVFRASLQRSLRPSREKWIPLRQIHDVPVTTITRKALRLTDPNAKGGLLAL